MFCQEYFGCIKRYWFTPDVARGADILLFPLLPSDAGRLGPDRKLIAAGLDKVEAAATGEVKQRAVDDAAMVLHLGLGCLDIGAVEHQQGAPLMAVTAHICAVEAAVQPFSLEGAVVGAVVGELPAKGGGEEGLGGGEIPGRKLHIVQFFMGFHKVPLPADK